MDSFRVMAKAMTCFYGTATEMDVLSGIRPRGNGKRMKRRVDGALLSVFPRGYDRQGKGSGSNMLQYGAGRDNGVESGCKT